VAGRDAEPTQPQGLLTYEAVSWVGSIYSCAGSALHDMEASWDRPVRHNKRLELSALRDALSLEVACTYALESDATAAAPLLPPDTEAETAYRWLSGLLAVDRLVVPHGRWERNALRNHSFRADSTAWGERVTEQYPELVAEWHNWLWLDLAGQPVRTREALGASAVLAAACGDLHSIAKEATTAHYAAAQLLA
jgi:hypothetical protein